MKLERGMKLGMSGKDVWATKRALGRVFQGGRLKQLASKTPAVRSFFGPGMQADVKRFQKKHGLPQTGVIGEKTFELLQKHMDPQARELYRDFVVSRQPKKPKLVIPNQGLGSLHSSLWDVYSIGRNMGMSDLGTYNPNSRLPSGRPSDHAKFPAHAFDLGISPQTGWSNATARKYAEAMAGRPEIEYIILSPRIWSRDKGWHSYPYGGHYNHVHVSGRG
jgi:hypothetical protein